MNSGRQRDASATHPTGFILTSRFRIVSDRPVVQLAGRLASGETFWFTEDRARPYFFVRTVDWEVLRKDEALRKELDSATIEVDPGEWRTLGGDPAVRLAFEFPASVTRLRDRIHRRGISTYEADLTFVRRVLIDRGIRGALQFQGAGDVIPAEADLHFDRRFANVEISPVRFTPQLEVLSFDLETDPRGHEVFSIALAQGTRSEVLVVDPGGSSVGGASIGGEEATVVDTERELFELFLGRVREWDPDILTGWNIVDFDLPVLERGMSRHGVPCELGRVPDLLRLDRGRARPGPIRIPGRVVLDGMWLLRQSFVKMESYALDAVARELLGEGKTIQGRGRASEIERLYRNDLARFVEYNRRDAQLVLEILDHLALVPLTIERSLLTGLPLDQVSGSIAAFDNLYLERLRSRRICAPSVGRDDPSTGEETFGGHVLESKPGLHRNVLTFDFKSLYPSIIRTFQIDPMGWIRRPEEADDGIVSPSGAVFGREPGILPAILDELFPRREAAKAAGDEVASQAIKILMNSLYGVLGTPSCRFHASQLANAITSFGRTLLQWCESHIESLGHAVLYGDTDSLFVDSGVDDPDEAERIGRALGERVNEDLRVHILETWRVDSRLDLEFERLYLRLHLPEARHSERGARKRYVGLVRSGDLSRSYDEENTRVVFIGMEAVRRDWTALARRLQRELYGRLLRGRELEETVRTTVEALFAGELDEELVYRKALRKKLSEYTATTPPHVAAARKIQGKPPRVVAYFMTINGPEPLGDTDSSIDYEHYLDKQVRPVVAPILHLVDLDFDRIIGRAGPEQLTLFDDDFE